MSFVYLEVIWKVFQVYLGIVKLCLEGVGKMSERCLKGGFVSFILRIPTPLSRRSQWDGYEGL